MNLLDQTLEIISLEQKRIQLEKEFKKSQSIEEKQNLIILIECIKIQVKETCKK